MKLTIAEVKQQLQQIEHEADERFHKLLADERKGVQQAIVAWRKQQQQREQVKVHYERMNRYETDLHLQGVQLIAGVDEVGRGPLAGPVVAAAVILGDEAIYGLDDSKKLSEVKRDELYERIVATARAYAVAIVDAPTIDCINIYEATKVAMQQAIEQLSIKPQHLLIDAMKLPMSIGQTSIIKGDATSNSIAAASIVAKVTRDRLMKQYAVQYPHYAFERNMGYGTKDHLQGLAEYGPIVGIHRFSFAPIKQ